MEITIKDFWTALKKSVVLMVICALLFGAIFYVYSSQFAAKVYSSSVEYTLTAKDGSVDDVEALNNYLVVGTKSIPSLESVLMSDKTMQSVLEYIETRRKYEPDNTDFVLSGTYTPSSLLGCFSFAWDNPETVVFTVHCKTGSAEDARILLEAFTNVIPESSKMVLHDVFSIEESTTPKDGIRVAPNIAKNTFFGAVIGTVFAYIAVLCVVVLDTRVKREKDLKSRFAQIPVLGQIPQIN